MTLHLDAVSTLSTWRPDSTEQNSLRHAFLAYLAARTDSCRRSCVPGHFTASVALIDAAAEHVLLTLHPRVGRWLQLGGHCEDADATLADAALREATEESGIDGVTVDPQPLHLAVHPITCSLGLPTHHFDVCFLGVAPPDAVPRLSAESLDLRWWPLAELHAESHAVPAFAHGIPALAALAAQRLTRLRRDVKCR